MALDTYSNLIDTIAKWLHRNGAVNQLSSDRIPEFIHLVEDELNTDDSLRVLVTDETFSTLDTDGNVSAIVDLPEDLTEIVSLYLPGYEPIRIVPPNQIADYGSLADGSGVPVAASINADASIQFAPQPDAEYVFTLTYYTGVPRLSETAPTNWVLNKHANVYLYGALMQAAPFLEDDERVPMWEKAFDKALAKARMAREKKEMSGNILSAYPTRGF